MLTNILTLQVKYTNYNILTLQVLKYTAGHINYGGRVTDDWDRRCIMNILEDFYCAAALDVDYKFSESGIYHHLPNDSTHQVWQTPLSA